MYAVELPYGITAEFRYVVTQTEAEGPEYLEVRFVATDSPENSRKVYAGPVRVDDEMLPPELLEILVEHFLG